MFSTVITDNIITTLNRTDRSENIECRDIIGWGEDD